IRWHMIGHLQSNKINQLFSVPNLYAIHSVHSISILEKMIKAESHLKDKVNIFLQYNTSREEEKAGFESYAELLLAGQLIKNDSKLKLFGLMTMGTLRTEDFEGEARRCFQELNLIRDRLSNELGTSFETSMGMSQDYHIA